MERRLAAVLAADVVGYSRLMGEDEAATLAALKACERDVVEPTVAANNGRIVKRMGDGFLVEFASAVDAVQCALDWQGASAGTSDTPIRFRIGVNLGDIIFQDDDIYGDGVNVAARLEGMADTGGICIASVVHDQVRRRIETAFRDLGKQTLKNIDEPVRVFAWSPMETSTEPEERAGAAVEKPEPSMLLVVPFRALGSDPLGQTLSEALTENIAVAMSHFDELTIVDPGSVPLDADVETGRALGRKFGVAFLLEGRVQASGDKVRVSAQIVEVESGQRQWSDSFDREVDDIFALQDELTAIVASTVGEGLLDLMSKALDKKPEAEWTPRELTIRGASHLHRVDREQTIVARDYFQKALAKDPEFPLAVVCECWTYAFDVMFGWPLSRDDPVDYCIDRVRDLLVRSDRHSQAHRLLSRVLHLKGDHASAVSHAERAFELNPYDSDMVMSLAQSYSSTGQGDRGVELAERAVRINPYAPEYYRAHLGMAYMVAERYEDALSVFDTLSRPIGNTRYFRAACLSALDRQAEARLEVDAILSERPGLTGETYRESLLFQEGPDLDRFLSNLRRAGLPE